MSTTTYDARWLKRPQPTADYTARSKFRAAGIAVGLTGLALALVPLVANLVAADEVSARRASTLAWSFGLNFTAFTLLKLGIAVTLMGIIVRLWMRVDGVKAALPRLKAPAEPEVEPTLGQIETPFGKGRATQIAPGALPPHLMARLLWAPMLAMGPILVLTGLVLSIVQAHKTGSPGTFQTLGAWVQGTQFLGEGLVLAGISFLLGTILGSLRAGGGEVQESLGLIVKTLKMPKSGIAFIGLLLLGLTTAVAQFALYLVAAYGDVDQDVWFAFLGPMREVALGTLLLGIVLALYTIGTVLGFQFHRIREIIVTGR
jgi:hypothetical protein